MKGPLRRNKKWNANQPKKRVKPKDMNIDEKKSIIYHCVRKACFVNQLQENDEDNEEKKENSKMKDGLNKMAVKWMSDKLDGLGLVDEVIDPSSNKLIDDIAIVSMASNEFEFVENMYLKDLLFPFTSTLSLTSSGILFFISFTSGTSYSSSPSLCSLFSLSTLPTPPVAGPERGRCY